jgi:hypothetical protein
MEEFGGDWLILLGERFKILICENSQFGEKNPSGLVRILDFNYWNSFIWNCVKEISF